MLVCWTPAVQLAICPAVLVLASWTAAQLSSSQLDGCPAVGGNVLLVRRFSWGAQVELVTGRPLGESGNKISRIKTPGPQGKNTKIRTKNYKNIV